MYVTVETLKNSFDAFFICDMMNNKAEAICITHKTRSYNKELIVSLTIINFYVCKYFQLARITGEKMCLPPGLKKSFKKE